MTGPAPTPSPDDVADDRPNAFEMLDGDLVLYECSNADAWIQSSTFVDFAGDRVDVSPGG